MTFSQQCKLEMLKVNPGKTCCMLSELSALTQTLGSLGLMGGGKLKVTYRVTSAELAKRVFQLLLLTLGIRAENEYSYHARFGGRQVCEVTVKDPDAHRLLSALHMMRPGGDVFKGVPRAAINRKCCRRAFMRGAFLGSGAIEDPENEYRLEIALPNAERAETLARVMEKSGINALQSERRGQTILYVKRGDDVSTLLAEMGAHSAMMQLENVRINKESMGRVNRALNCDNANMKKQLQAGENQLQRIMWYSLNCSLAGLNEDLSELARVRMLNPDVSLEQLGQMLTPPCTKSAVNYRMRKLMSIISAAEAAENARETNEEKPQERG